MIVLRSSGTREYGLSNTSIVIGSCAFTGLHQRVRRDQLAARDLALLQRHREVVVLVGQHVARRQIAHRVDAAHQRVEIVDLLRCSAAGAPPRCPPHISFALWNALNQWRICSGVEQYGEIG